MPYLKPEQLIKVQHLIDSWEREHIEGTDDTDRAISEIMGVCPVCGGETCTKDVVKANNVYVHPEDVAEAEPIARGQLP